MKAVIARKPSVSERSDDGPRLPILGGDVAGVVENADPHSKKGDRVFALTPGFYNTTSEGTYAEYVAVEEAHLATAPKTVDLSKAGTIPLVALTAWQALNAAKPVAGQSVLVTAASGGVGTYTIQLAKALGLYTVGTCGPSNVTWVKDFLGADEVVDYTKEDLVDKYKDQPFDIVVDCMGARGDSFNKALQVINVNGHLSYTMNPGTTDAVQLALSKAQARAQQGAGPAIHRILVHPSGEQLATISSLIDEGKVKVVADITFKLEEVAKGHAQVETGHTRGKVAILVAPEA